MTEASISDPSVGRRETRIDFEVDPRYATSNREARIALIYWAVYAVVIIAVSWILGSGKKPHELTFVFGYPAWFFWGVLVAGAVLCVVPYFLVKLF